MIDPPIVYIEKEPFLAMLLASIDTFKRECFGYIFGYKPTKNRNSFVITSAGEVGLTKKRKNKEVDQSVASKKRMKSCFEKYPALFRPIGDFHSHPEWGEYTREPGLSDSDIEDMIKDEIPLGVVIKILSINKERYAWERTSTGGFIGSLGRYKFYFNAFRVFVDKEGKAREQVLMIQAPAAIKALNRALGYQV